MTSEFRGKIALITGSGRGIGRAIALYLAERGADIGINFFRNRAPAEKTARDIRGLGRRAWVVKANVGELADVERMFQELDAGLAAEGLPPGLDILVHNAASGYNRPAMEQKPRGWEWTMNINARALLFMAQQARPRMCMRGGGAIVSITSPGSRRVLPGYVVVGASKAAIESLTRYLAVELSPDNIVVNAVSPGIVLTDALKHFEAYGSQESIVAQATQLTPAGRLATPEDVAGVVAFLCSPDAAMIRGQVIEVDGGASLPGK